MGNQSDVSYCLKIVVKIRILCISTMNCSNERHEQDCWLKESRIKKVCLWCAADATASSMFSLPFLLSLTFWTWDLSGSWFLSFPLGGKSGETVSSRRLLLYLTYVPYIYGTADLHRKLSSSLGWEACTSIFLFLAMFFRIKQTFY